ncbi:MAG: glycosyltransferase family 2 protein [Planktomarina sp.]
MVKATLIGIAKDEGPFLWEWVAYHRSIGFTDIVIFENDSSDYTQGLLKAMEQAGFIYNFYNPAAEGQHQMKAYQRASRMNAYLDADWVMAIDIDEFLNIKIGDGLVSDLAARGENLDCFLINWRMFGNSLQIRTEPGLVTERFTLCNRARTLRGGRLGHKGFFRPKKFKYPGVHFPVMKDEGEDLRFANGSGAILRELPDVRWHSMDPGMQSVVQLNHYIVKDAESFVNKVARGRAHQTNALVDAEYWQRNNINHTVDVSILRHMQRTHEVMKEMDMACGGDLSRITQRSYDWHKENFAELLKQEKYRALYELCSGQKNVHDLTQEDMVRCS